jgi:hypothetical protein
MIAVRKKDGALRSDHGRNCLRFYADFNSLRREPGDWCICYRSTTSEDVAAKLRMNDGQTVAVSYGDASGVFEFEAVSSERKVVSRTRPEHVPTDAIDLCVTHTTAGPNKPMVRTATRALAEPALPSRRRHIGQPLNSPPRLVHFGRRAGATLPFSAPC